MNENRDKFAGYDGIVESIDDIRAVIGEPINPVKIKTIDHIDQVARDIIEKTPFVVIASADGNGYPDVSPKGDPAGFVQVLDEKHLAIPDRPGNKRVDTFQNLLDNPYLALIFIIPGKGETLRVTGEVRLVRDEKLRESMAIKGRIPEFAIVMHVERVLIHCPKAIIRAGLWQPDAWPDSSNTANIGEAMVVHAKLDMTADELEERAEKEGLTELY